MPMLSEYLNNGKCIPFITLCTRDTINYLTSETDTTRRGAWRKMESGELTIILILQAFMRGSLGQELAEK